MSRKIECLTAETEPGRLAIEEVMQHSYISGIDSVPAEWARVRIVDGMPVSFILVDPTRHMEFPGGDIRYAFIEDVATRADRRGEGHFRGLMEHTFSSLRAAGIPFVVLHGEYQLYRRFGFDVFTHHCGIFATTELIERRLGVEVSEEAQQLLEIEDSEHLHGDLLLVTDVRAKDLSECKAALQTAAALAQQRGKARILFEYPAAPSYGSRYPIHPSPETQLTTLARACGAQVCVKGADPEGGSIPDADWIKVLDAEAFVREVLKYLEKTGDPPPEGMVCFDTDAGSVTIESSGGKVTTSAEIRPGAPAVKWPSSALVQLVVGYQTAEVLSAIHATPIPNEKIPLLDALFPRRWRFSRNESWTFGE